MPATQLDPRVVLHGLARTNLEVFLQLVFGLLNPREVLNYGWYLEAIVRALEEIEDGTNRRLQITVPPRHLKSISTNVAFPAWLMGRDPTTKIICASYVQDLSNLHARAFRKVVGSQMYREIFQRPPLPSPAKPMSRWPRDRADSGSRRLWAARSPASVPTLLSSMT